GEYKCFAATGAGGEGHRGLPAVEGGSLLVGELGHWETRASEFLRIRLQGWCLGFVQAASLRYAARHAVVAGARAFVVEAIDGEVAVADVLDELADEAVDD